jgi:hypothetical protein
MKKVIIVVALIGLGIFYFVSRPPQNQDFILGKWKLVDMGSTPTSIDYIIFNPDKKIEIYNKDASLYSSGNYSFYNRKEIDCECIVNGKTAIFTLTLTDGNKKIVNSMGQIFQKVSG